MMNQTTTLKLYGHKYSGHCHRIQLYLSLLGIEADWEDVDLLNGAHKEPAFLAKNYLGQVPVLEDGDATIADSNAILVYLALRYDTSGQWYPSDPLLAAEVQRYLSLAAGPVAYGPAAARLVTVFGATLDAENAIAIAEGLLQSLDQHLGQQQWLVGDNPTLADVACYSYIAHAPEGNVSLEAFANVRAWLERIEALPGFIPMPKTAAGLCA